MSMEKILIVAELSANHNGSLDLALKTIKAAKEAGADAIKIQTYRPDTITVNRDDEPFIVKDNRLWNGRKLYDLYSEAHTPWEWHEELKSFAESLGLEFFSTPFDETSVDYLETLRVKRYKISSYEITDLSLIEYVAKKNKPIIFSDGVATIEELDRAISICRKYNNNVITVLKCTSQYPAKIEDANLNMFKFYKEKFLVEIGLSDHTEGFFLPVLSVPYGINMIEKHFVLDRSKGGPDASFSMEPDEFEEMVKMVRLAEKSINTDTKTQLDIKNNARFYTRSLYFTKDLPKGHKIEIGDLKSRRPLLGVSSEYRLEVIGKVLTCNVKENDSLLWEDIEDKLYD
jgi:pseudaminic acid synthase